MNNEILHLESSALLLCTALGVRELRGEDLKPLLCRDRSEQAKRLFLWGSSVHKWLAWEAAIKGHVFVRGALKPAVRAHSSMWQTHRCNIRTFRDLPNIWNNFLYYAALSAREHQDFLHLFPDRHSSVGAGLGFLWCCWLVGSEQLSFSLSANWEITDAQ